MDCISRIGCLILICLLAASLSTAGCATLLDKDKKDEGADDTTSISEEQELDLRPVIEATGFSFQSFMRGKIYILGFDTEVGSFPVVLRWSSDKKDYVSIKLRLLNQPDGYTYTFSVMQRLNELNVRYDALKFVADMKSGDVQIIFNLDSNLLDPERLKDIVSAMAMVAEKEFVSLAGLMPKK